LVDPRFAQRIAALLPAGAHVIEIGGGTGALTAALVQSARELDALEVDKGLAEILRERFAGDSRVRIHQTDALEYDLAGVLTHTPPPRAVCGNLPYYITTPLLERIVACSDDWEACVVMVQREYGRRMAARPGTPEYSSLSVFVAYHCDVEHCFDAGAAAFYPAPAISSTVLRLTPKRDRAAGVRDPDLLLWLVRAAFAQRRKTLINSVTSQLTSTDASKSLIEDALRSIGSRSDIRGERLSLADFIRLANALQAQGFRAPRQR
jgi:16S rRNA (adenine1518-N6/adenine1519-N6)-dimethyltransferase